MRETYLNIHITKDRDSVRLAGNSLLLAIQRSVSRESHVGAKQVPQITSIIMAYALLVIHVTPVKLDRVRGSEWVNEQVGK